MFDEIAKKMYKYCVHGSPCVCHLYKYVDFGIDCPPAPKETLKIRQKCITDIVLLNLIGSYITVALCMQPLKRPNQEP